MKRKKTLIDSDLLSTFLKEIENFKCPAKVHEEGECKIWIDIVENKVVCDECIVDHYDHLKQSKPVNRYLIMSKCFKYCKDEA
jgi:hypothetical protein